MGKWTRFMDMHSGGGSKEDYDKIYIELPEDKAKVFFYKMFGHNPERISCTCCGEDYSISEGEDLLTLTAYDRKCTYSYEKGGYIENGISIEDYKNNNSVLFIYESDIKKEDYEGDLPSQGYVWID